MQQVFKYTLNMTDITHVAMPQGGQVLSAQVQHGNVQVWALVDPSKPEEARTFRIAGTGHPIEHANIRFIGTVQMQGGSLVFHVFEVLDNIVEA